MNINIKLLRKIKEKIDNCKFGGLIYILFFIVIMLVCRGCFRTCYYNKTLTPEQYRTTYVYKESSFSPGDTSSDACLCIGIEYEVDGIIQKEELFYEGSNINKIYHTAIHEIKYSEISEVTEIEKYIGNIHYNKNHPEKMIYGDYFGMSFRIN